MSEAASFEYDGRQLEFPVIIGSENETAVDISKLRAETGVITLDEGFVNTGSAPYDVSGHWLCNRPSSVALPAETIAPGASLMVSLEKLNVDPSSGEIGSPVVDHRLDLLHNLRIAHVHVDHVFGLFVASTHFFNTQADIDYLVELQKSML